MTEGSPSLDRSGPFAPLLGGEVASGVESNGDVTALVSLVERVVRARVKDAHLAEELVQEAVARVMSVRRRLDERALGPYAIVTARNLVATAWRRDDARQRNAHRLLDRSPDTSPEDEVIRREEQRFLTDALERLGAGERAALLAHEVDGRDTESLAAEWDSTPGAVAAQLHRARAKLRVEFLLAREATDPPSNRCRPVLLALSAGERRRQRDLDVGDHLLRCDFCATLSEPLLDRRTLRDDGDEVRIRVRSNADVVVARQRGRERAEALGFGATDVTLVATAISEIARNIVQFAGHGEIVIRTVEQDDRVGISVEARDVGRGIDDLAEAMTDGYSSYGGMGLGLPGARRLMDEFDVTSAPGRGTKVMMTKWRR